MHTEEILSKALADVSQDEDDLGISNHVAVEMHHDEPEQESISMVESDTEENLLTLLRSDGNFIPESQQIHHLQTVPEDEEFVNNSDNIFLSSKSGSPSRKLKDLHPIVIPRDSRDFSLDDEIPGFHILPNHHHCPPQQEDINMSIDSGESSIYTKYRRQANELQELKSVKVALEARLEEARYLLQMFAGLPSTRSRHNLRSIGSEKDLALSPFSHFPTIIDELEDTIKDISIETIDKPNRPRAFFKEPDPRELSRDSSLTSTPEEPTVHQPRRVSKVEHKIPEGIFHPHAPVSPVLETTHHHDIHHHQDGNHHNHEKHVTYSDEYQMYPPVHEESVSPSTDHLEMPPLEIIDTNGQSGVAAEIIYYQSSHNETNYVDNNEVELPSEASSSLHDDISQSLHSDKDADHSPTGSKSSSLLKKIETLKLRRKGLTPASQAASELHSFKSSDNVPDDLQSPVEDQEILQAAHPLSLQPPISDEQHGVFTKPRASPRTSKVLLGKLSPTARNENKGSPRESSTVVTSMSIQLPDGLSEPSPEQEEKKAFTSPLASPRDVLIANEVSAEAAGFPVRSTKDIDSADEIRNATTVGSALAQGKLLSSDVLLHDAEPESLMKENEYLSNEKVPAEEKLLNMDAGTQKKVSQIEMKDLTQVPIKKEPIHPIKVSGPPPLPFDEEAELRVNAKHNFPASFSNALHYNDQSHVHGETPIDYVYFGRDEVVSPLSMNSDLLEAEKKMESSFSEPISENRENSKSRQKSRTVISAKKEVRPAPSNSYLDSYNRVVQSSSANNSRGSNKKGHVSTSKDPPPGKKKDPSTNLSLVNPRVSSSSSPSSDNPQKSLAGYESSPLVAAKSMPQPSDPVNETLFLEKTNTQELIGSVVASIVTPIVVLEELAEEKARYMESAPPSPPPLSPEMEATSAAEKEVVLNQQVLPPSPPPVERPPSPPTEEKEDLQFSAEKEDPISSNVLAPGGLEEMKTEQLLNEEEGIPSADRKKPDLQVDVVKQFTDMSDPVDGLVSDVISPFTATHDIISPLSNSHSYVDSPLANNHGNLQGLEHLTHYYLPFLIASKYLEDSSLRGSRARKQLLSSIHYPEIILWLVFQSYGTSDGILVKQIK
jgi:hypothetical protein